MSDPGSEQKVNQHDPTPVFMVLGTFAGLMLMLCVGGLIGTLLHSGKEKEDSPRSEAFIADHCATLSMWMREYPPNFKDAEQKTWVFNWIEVRKSERQMVRDHFPKCRIVFMGGDVISIQESDNLPPPQ